MTLLQDIGQGIVPLLDKIFINPDNLSKLLLGVLLWIVLYSIVQKMKLGGGMKSASAAIAVIMVILTFIYLPQGFLEAIVLQYGAMGATILTIIPFAIILYFSLTTDNLFMARVTWIFYIVYYLTLFFYKIVTVSTWTEAIPFIGAIIAGIIAFILLATMRGWIFKGKIEELSEAGEQAATRRKNLLKAERESLEAFGGAK
jgi:hypothetical protein